MHWYLYLSSALHSCLSLLSTRVCVDMGFNCYQEHVEAHVMYVILKLSWEYGIIRLIIIKTAAVSVHVVV